MTAIFSDRYLSNRSGALSNSMTLSIDRVFLAPPHTPMPGLDSCFGEMPAAWSELGSPVDRVVNVQIINWARRASLGPRLYSGGEDDDTASMIIPEFSPAAFMKHLQACVRPTWLSLLMVDDECQIAFYSPKTAIYVDCSPKTHLQSLGFHLTAFEDEQGTGLLLWSRRIRASYAKERK